MTKGVFTMSLVQKDAEVVKAAVNQGIDSYLEACYVPDRGDSYEWDGRRLNCKVSAESLPVLIRRLSEMDSERAQMLAIDIEEVSSRPDEED